MNIKKNNVTKKSPPKQEANHLLAARIGASPTAVYLWRRNGTLPKNALVRAAYLKAISRKPGRSVTK